MENISENQIKRGRPLKVLDDGRTRKEAVAYLASVGLYDDVKSERAKINNYYMVEAHSALRNQDNNFSIDGEFSFLISVNGREDVINYKRTILQELGRLENPELIREVARGVCEYRLSTSRAITYIKLFKTGKQPAGDALNLATAIEKIIYDYRIKHADVTLDMILHSINIVSDTVLEKIYENMEEIDSL